MKTLDTYPKVRKLDSPLDAGHARPDLGRPPRGDGPVQPEGRLRPDNRVHRHDRRRRRQDRCRAIPSFDIEELGSASTGKAVDEAFAGMLKTAGMIALPLTLIILLLVFGSAVAALDPASCSRSPPSFATTALIALPSQFIPVDEQIAEVILLIGLAVGIDYSLFYLRREREERAAGRSEHAALEAAAATSGRAVLVSGITVLIAMAGMFLSGDKTFMSFSIGTMMVVAVAMLGSLTVLPALLGRLGDKVEKGRIPFLGRLRSKNGESRFWGAVLDRVLRRPVISAVAAGAVLIALTDPGVLAEHDHDRSRRHLDPRDRADEAARRCLPGRQRPGRRRDQGGRRPRPRRSGRDRRPEAAGARERPDEGPDRRRGQPRQHRRNGRHHARRLRHRRQVAGRARHAPRGRASEHARPGRRRRVRRRRHDRPGQGLGRRR